MTEDELVNDYGTRVPVDESLLAPLGRVTWAAIRLQHKIRDAIGLDLGEGPSDEPFDKTLGGAITILLGVAERAGTPWSIEIAAWADDYGRPAQRERDRITHGVAYTTENGEQALQTARRHGNPERVTTELLQHAAGRLERASVRLGESLDRCRATEA